MPISLGPRLLSSTRILPALVVILSWWWWRATETASSGVFHAATTSAHQPCIAAVQVVLPDDARYQQAIATIAEAYYPKATNDENGSVDSNSNKSTQQQLSKHWFVRQAPVEIQTAVRTLTWDSSVVQDAIRNAIKSSSFNNNINKDRPYKYWPDAFSEIYLMRPEFDWVDNYKRHYDGILKLPTNIVPVCTIRALTYVAGPPATLVAVTSGTSATTWNSTMVLLDFHRELHYANTSSSNNNSNATPARLMLKTALHVVQPRTWNDQLLATGYVMIHRIVFFVIKSVRSLVESTDGSNDSNNEWLLGLMMLLDNGMRSLNKMHMVLPLLCVAVPLVLVLLAPMRKPGQFGSYLVHMMAVSVETTTNSMISLWLVVGFRLWERYCLHRRLLASLDNDSHHTCWLIQSITTACMVRSLGLQLSDNFTNSAGAASLAVAFARAVTVEMVGLAVTMTVVSPCAVWVSPTHGTTTILKGQPLRTTHVRQHVPLLLFHLAWAWLTVYVAHNADMARDILFAPMLHVEFEETL